MKTLKLKSGESVPANFTGAIGFPGGNKAWYLNRTFHRIDGPAIEYYGGNKVWYLNGRRMTEEEHTKQTRPMKTSLGKLIWKGE